MAHDDEPKVLVILLVLAVALHLVARSARPEAEPQRDSAARSAVVTAAGLGDGCLACFAAGGSGSGLIPAND